MSKAIALFLILVLLCESALADRLGSTQSLWNTPRNGVASSVDLGLRADPAAGGAGVVAADTSAIALQTTINPECLKESTSKDEPNCVYVQSEVMASFRQIQEIGGNCLPAGNEENSFAVDHTRDLCVCSCLRNGISVQADAFQRENSRAGVRINDLVQDGMNRNINRLNLALRAERNAMEFQASTLPTSSAEETRLMASYFTPRDSNDFSIEEMVRRARSAATETWARLSDRTVRNPRQMNGIEDIRNSDPKLLTSMPNDLPELCVPQRFFMTTRQMPSDALFFEDIANMSDTYNETDWDYQDLRKRFVDASRGVNSLQEADQIPEARRLHARIKFLDTNPLYKNLFSSTSTDRSRPSKKQQLFSMIKNAYGRDVTASNRPQKYNLLRSQTGAFFSNPANEVEPMVQSGARYNMTMFINDVARRVGDLTGRYDAGNDWAMATSKYDQNLPEGGTRATGTPSDRRNPAIYAQFCGQIEFSSGLNQYKVLEDLDDEAAKFYSSDYNKNTDYVNFSANVCGVNRQNAQGVQKNFIDFKQDFCRSNTTRECTPEGHEQLLLRFLNEFPERTDQSGVPTLEEEGLLKMFLSGEARLQTLSTTEASLAGTEGRNRGFTRDGRLRGRLERVNSAFESDAAVISSGGRVNAVLRSSANLERAQVQGAQAQTQNQQNQNTQTPQNPTYTSLPVVTPDNQAGIRPTAEAAVTPQAQAAGAPQRVNPEVDRLRTELADLNRELARENAKAPSDRNGSQITELNSRLDSLSRNLEEAQRTNRNLRDQIAEGDTRNQRSQQRSDTTSGSGDLGRSPASFSPSSAVVNPSGQNPTDSSSVPVPPNLGGAASFSGNGAASLAARPTVQLSSGNSALLSKYGVQSGSVQGALIVANPGATIDYQTLRSQSAESVIPLTLSPEEFNLIARNDQTVLNRYLDRVRAMPGNVVRLDISATGIDGRPLEFFVVKNGNDFSIVPGIASTPSRTPASLPAGAREFTLNGLRQELGR